MVTLRLTDEQVINLVKQLSLDQQETVLGYLLTPRWQAWTDLSKSVQPRIRELARERGRNWEAMGEQARQDFVDELVHEDRARAR
ncbi:MAG: hypothetical protein HYY04_10335 [Chloroflexi bacterium]|nr:hypothetical protein [Chloroflexota bacterium]